MLLFGDDECPLVYLKEPPPLICPKGEVACSLPDLDQDGDVDINDFLDLLALWGEPDCHVFKRGDINWDGEVGIVDLLIILEAWGVYESATWDRCDCDKG